MTMLDSAVFKNLMGKIRELEVKVLDDTDWRALDNITSASFRVWSQMYQGTESAYLVLEGGLVFLRKGGHNISWHDLWKIDFDQAFDALNGMIDDYHKLVNDRKREASKSESDNLTSSLKTYIKAATNKDLVYRKASDLLSHLIARAEKKELERLLNKLALAEEIIKTTQEFGVEYNSGYFEVKWGVHTKALWKLRNKQVFIILSPNTMYEVPREVNKEFFELPDSLDYEGACKTLETVVEMTSKIIKHTVEFFDTVYAEMIKL